MRRCPVSKCNCNCARWPGRRPKLSLAQLRAASGKYTRRSAGVEPHVGQVEGLPCVARVEKSRARDPTHARMGLLTVIQKNKCAYFLLVRVMLTYVKDKDREIRVLFLGLDNAGKTTTLKHLMNERVDTVSPTFGFAIKTFTRQGYVQEFHLTLYRYTLNVCMFRCTGTVNWQELTRARGRWGAAVSAAVLAQLFRKNGCHRVGCRQQRPASNGRLSAGAMVTSW